MMSFLGRWRVKTLLASWIAYWIVLFAAKFGSAVLAGWRATRTEGSAINVSADGSAINIAITQSGAPAWTGSEAIGPLVLWIVIPPLLIWGLWLFSTRQQRNARVTPGEIGSGDGIPQRSTRREKQESQRSS
jgi:hypothetical protein